MAFRYQMKWELEEQAAYEGFMDLIKSVANKVKDSFSKTLKKITDITTRGVSTAESTNWSQVLGMENPVCNEYTHILTFSQAMNILSKLVPSIVDDTKKIVPVYNKIKPVSDLPPQEELEKIKNDIEENTNYEVCKNMSFGPDYSGNSGCNWNTSNTRRFIDSYLRTAKAGLPQEVIRITGDDKEKVDDADVTKAITDARWLVKAYGKCIAETSRTVIELSSTCGIREEAEKYS